MLVNTLINFFKAMICHKYDIIIMTESVKVPPSLKASLCIRTPVLMIMYKITHHNYISDSI